jgi:hypothetical protein
VTGAARDLQAEQDHAEWHGWMDAQGYDFADDSYQAEAFAAGMQAERDLAATEEPQPVTDADRLLDWAAKLIATATEEADVLSAPWRSEQQDWLSAFNATPPAQPAPASPHLECAVCASGVTVPHGAGGTPGQAREALEVAVRSAVTENRDCRGSVPCGFCERRINELLAAIDGYAAAQEPHAAPGLRADLEATVRTWREESEPYPDEDAADTARRGGFGYCADELAQILAQHAPAEAKPAPELAAYEADIASLTDQRNRVSETADQLRAVITDMLDAFGPSGSGHTARVGQVQIAKWRTRAGLTS